MTLNHQDLVHVVPDVLTLRQDLREVASAKDVPVISVITTDLIMVYKHHGYRYHPHHPPDDDQLDQKSCS